ncbi:MAG TPA: AAA family ATPase [Polyangiaceae bacterium]|nr:AAA family ATPase [Polyangiaceae bacterium]
MPAPPALFVGRDREISRTLRALRRLPMAVLYGVAGAGKSALAYACGAAWPGPVLYARAADDRPLASLVDELCDALCAPRPRRELDDESLGAELASALDERGALLLLDDADRLTPPARGALLRALGERLRHGRVVVSSRVRLHAEGHYDRFELVVRGLDEASARRLWQGLDRLRGPRAGFETAYRLAKGCPAALRRAHAGDPLDVDPYAPAVGALEPDARFIAAALALAGKPLGAATLRRLLPGDRADQARRELAEHLLVEVDGTGACALHEPARDAIFAGLGRCGLSLDEVRLALAAALAAPDAPAPRGRRAVTSALSSALAPPTLPDMPDAPAASPDAPAGDAAVLDACRHELRAGGRTLRLAERPVLRGLLYALASSPNAVVSKEALVGAVWSVRYHPLRHDNALFVNIRRLREALSGTGLAVHNRDGGYALSVPARFVHLAPSR